MSAHEVDWDAGTENAYEAHRLRVVPDTGLCARPWCDDAALPNEAFCADCLGDVENMVDAYEADDPKSPGYHDRMCELADGDRL